MPNTPNLLIPHVGASAQKADPFNEGIDALDNAGNAVTVIDLTAGDVVLTDTQYLRSFLLRFTGGPAADRVVTIGAQERHFAIHNQLTTENDILLDTATTGGTQAVIPRGALAVCHSDGENVFVLGQQGITPYDVAFFIPQVEESVTLHQFVAVRPFSLFPSLPGSEAFAESPLPTDEDAVTIDIRRNDGVIGSILFDQGSQTGVFTFSSRVNFVAGDRLSFTTGGFSSATPNPSSLLNVAITLKTVV